jgi:hypothetical protein
MPTFKLAQRIRTFRHKTHGQAHSKTTTRQKTHQTSEKEMTDKEKEDFVPRLSASVPTDCENEVVVEWAKGGHYARLKLVGVDGDTGVFLSRRALQELMDAMHEPKMYLSNGK